MTKQKILSTLSSYSTILIISVPMLLIAAFTDLFGGSLLVRIVTALFVNMIVVMGCRVFLANWE